MDSRARARRVKPVYGWAWMVRGVRGDWELCFWLCTAKHRLTREPKPSSEAVAVRVRLSLDRRARRLGKQARRG